MDDSRIVSIPELREFLKVSKDIKFLSAGRRERYKWINQVLNRFNYLRLKRQADKSQVLKYILRLTGLSKIHLKRLVKKKKNNGLLTFSENWGRKNTFTTVYSPSDIALLVRVDNAHNRLNGVATKKILINEWENYHKAEFKNLKNISLSTI